MTGIPCRQMVKVLTEEEVTLIHEASLRILERTGVRFDSEDARQRLVKTGAAPHPSRKDVVTFPRSIVESAVSRAPREVTYFARDPRWNIRHDGEHMFAYSGGGDPEIIDLETGAARPSTYADVENAAKLGDALEYNHLASHLVVPNDVPPAMIELKTMEAAMKNSAKVMSHHATSPAQVDYMVKMWSCVAGGEEEFRKRPLLSLGSSPSSPLTYPRHVCDVLIRSAELGVPFSIIPCPIAGGTGPVTIGGSLALQNAEMLAGLVLIQTIAPSLPSVYCGRVCFMDLRTGREQWGVPEEALASAAMIQLARRYRMVGDTCGPASDITRWDYQMGLERMMVSLVPAMAGAESMSGMGDVWEAVSSLEMMVLDNDLYDLIARIMKGISVGGGSLSLDLGSQVGRASPSSDRQNMPRQQRQCGHDLPLLQVGRDSGAAQRAARERVKRILKEHSPMPLDRDVERDVERILKVAQKELVG